AHRQGQAGLVELWPAVEPAELPPIERWQPPVGALAADSPVERLARIIAGRIRSWLDEGERLPARGRPVHAGDIMVLVRRRGVFVEHLVRALKDRQVPVAGIDRMVLAEQLAVMDLMALGQFLLLPSDDLTLAVVLKSPLIGFDEGRLFDLAHDRRPRSLWQALQRRRSEHPDFARAVQYLEALLARVDFTPPFELYADVLGPLQGRRRLVERLGAEALDPLDEFLSAALAFERTHVASLQGFLSWLARGKSDIKRDLEPARDQVRVMTVHGAKGLQAPIVILPDTMQVPKSGPKLLWPAGDDIPLWSPSQRRDDELAASARAAARLAGEREYRRLLYVAMTRAEDRLYVAGWRRARGGAAGCWYELIERGLAALGEAVPIALTGGLQGPGRRLASPQTALPVPDRAAAGSTAAAAPSLPEWAGRSPPAEPDPPRPLAPSRPEGEEPTVRSPTGSEDSARLKRGRLIHRLLQSLPDLPRRSRAAAARRWLGRPVHRLAADEIAELEREVLAVLEHPDFAPLFGPGSRAEVPLAGLIRLADGSTRRVAGQVDRLVVAAGKVLVLDYKSNRPAATRESDVSSYYIKQMAAYRAVLREIYPDHEVACVLGWTEIPLLMQLSDALLAAHPP
ncbi:MAG: PD-(D/E)XK nuclease family protein, partial [Proteobacteria bacterium]|nr:PD-(D/E)XK nuclease family protein [Pseudomonadota bacterium]